MKQSKGQCDFEERVVLGFKGTRALEDQIIGEARCAWISESKSGRSARTRDNEWPELS